MPRSTTRGTKAPFSSLTSNALNWLIPCSLPETLLIETAPPVQQQAVQGHAGGQPKTLRQALALGEMQVEQVGLAGTLGEIFIAGPEFIDQMLVQCRNTQPDLARGDLVHIQLWPVARHKALEQLMGGIEVFLELLPALIGVLA